MTSDRCESGASCTVGETIFFEGMRGRDNPVRFASMIPIPAHEPEVVLFDMDGVLFDTMPIHVSSWAETATHYGLRARVEEFYLFEGMKGTQTVKELYRRQKGKEPAPEYVEEVYRHKCAAFRASKTPILPIEGVGQLVRYMAERGIQIGVVTGSTRHNAEERILRDFSDIIDPKNMITADEVTNGKPDPEPYTRGGELFDTDPSSILVIENAPLGVRSAVDAGLFTIAVTTGPIPEHTLRQEGANLIMGNMKALQVWWQHTFDRQ